MALINCPECGNKISDSTKHCIHCGKEIILCPECKTPMPSPEAPCPSCGYSLAREQKTDPTAPPKKKAPPTGSAREVYEDFKKTSNGYKIFSTVRLIWAFVLAFSIIGLAGVMFLFTVPSMSPSELTDIEEMLSLISMMLVLFCPIMGIVILIFAYPLGFADMLIMFFGIRSRGFKIGKTLDYLCETKNKKKNSLEKVADNVVWLEIYSLCDKPSMILYFISYVWENLLLVSFMSTFWGLSFAFLPEILYSIVYDVLKGLLQSTPPKELTAIAVFILAFVLGGVIAVGVAYLATLPAQIIKLVIKQRKQVILSNWQSGVLTVEEKDEESEGGEYVSSYDNNGTAYESRAAGNAYQTNVKAANSHVRSKKAPDSNDAYATNNYASIDYGHIDRYSVHPNDVAKNLREWETISNIMWLVIGILQCCTFVFSICGIWNIVSSIRGLKNVNYIIVGNSNVIPYYEKQLIPLITAIFLNLILGGVIGVVLVIAGFVIRAYALNHKYAFLPQ